MMRSMFSGVSGLRAHQTKMDVIANNISNVNTTGYKSSRVTFQEVFSQTLAGASAANLTTGRGGVNPMQIGLGVNVASIDMQMTSGAAQRTDNPFDIMVQGEGFFIVSDASGPYFTRAGAFRLDKNGFISNPQGMVLNGWKAEPGPEPGTQVVQKNAVQPIQITGSDEYMEPTVTSFIRFAGNLNALTDPVKDSTIAFFDSLGNRYVMDVRFVYDSDPLSPEFKSWTVSLGNYMYPEGDKRNGVLLDIVGNAAAMPPDMLPLILTPLDQPDPANPVAFGFNTTFGPLKFNVDGKVDLANSMPGFVMEFDTTGVSALSPDARFADISAAFTGLTQYSGNTTATAETADGNRPGFLDGVSIGPDGIITGRYSNGETKKLWQVALAQFKNPAGLERMGANLYVTTPNSGDFDGVGVEAGAGTTLLAGVLEMSNVDLAAEFTEMITAQRGFQANSRIISASDEMLIELVNLKR